MNELSTPSNWYDGIAKQIDLIGEALNRRNYRKHKIETLRCLAHRIDQFSPECGQCQMFKQDISTMVQDVSSISRITTKESKKRYFGSIKSIIGHLQREHKLVTEGYYTGLGIAIGSGLGVAIGTAMDNVGSGIPIGVGVGLAGIVNAKKGVLRYSPYFGWHDVPLVEILRSRLLVPVYIDNDVNTLTLNEQLFGTGQGKENFITVTIGRGVGLGIVVNGQIYRGGNGAGGEFGHTIIDPEGHQCDCGKKGCLETYVSDPALLRLASEAAARGELPEEPRTVDELIAYAKSGVSVAQLIIAQSGVILGCGIANLITIFNPQEVIISGEGVRAGELMFESMRATIAQYAMPGLAEDTDICIDIWEDDAWARGAASLVLRELFTFPVYKEKKE